MGYQIIWTTLASRSDVDVRRLFTDQGDSPHRICDLFGVSLSWELDGPVILNLLEKQRIPLWSSQRKEKDPIVFGGGPVLTANPEPFAPFFDLILIGEGENLVPHFLESLNEVKNEDRENKLIYLSKVPGIYVPRCYEPKYSRNGQLIKVEPIHINIPNTISKQTWKGESLSHSTVITPDAAWPNIHMVEVVRSCPELCRFCLASYLNLPFRSASVQNELIPAVNKGIKVTNRIGLLGASVTQHPEFDELLTFLNKEKYSGIRLSISSVRAATVTPKLTSILTKLGSKSLTIAIESGSDRIRNMINKKLTKNEICNAINYAKEGGLKNVKLYGMVGLPKETEEDIHETADLITNLKQTTPGIRLTLGVSTFVPKAQTPFQWHGVRIESKKRLKLLSKRLKPHGIDIRPESFGWSLIQALISRSDRRLAPVILEMRRLECTLGNWKKAYKNLKKEDYIEMEKASSNTIPLPPSWEEIIHSDWSETKILPWIHIKGPINIETLLKHNQDAINQFSQSP